MCVPSRSRSQSRAQTGGLGSIDQYDTRSAGPLLIEPHPELPGGDKSFRSTAGAAVQDRAEQLPALTVEALHLHLLDRIEIRRAGVDLDTRQQHAEFEFFQAS